MVSAERLRLDEADAGGVSWRRWGLYLSGRTGAAAGLFGDFDELMSARRGEADGASHQTGWTGIAGLLALLFRGIGAEGLRARGRGAVKSAAAGERAGSAR